MIALFRTPASLRPPLSPRRAALRRQRIMDRSAMAFVLGAGVIGVLIWFQ